MKGWKTWLGMGITVLAGALMSLGKAYPEIQWAEPVGDGLLLVGGSLGIVGVGHKIEKAGQAKVVVSEVGTIVQPEVGTIVQPVTSPGVSAGVVKPQVE